MNNVATQHTNRTALRATTQALALCALGISAVLGIRLFGAGFFSPQDEGILLVYPDLILRGYLPYKDFSSIYSPLGFYLLSGVFRIFGESVFVERSLGAAYWFLIVVAMFCIGSRVNRVTAILSAATALVYLSLWQGLGAHVHLGAYVCMLFALSLAGKDCDRNELVVKRLVTLAGLVAGTTFWFKQDLGVVAITATLVSIDPRSTRRLRPFLAGVAIPVCALTVFAIVIGPAEVFDSLILDPLRSAPGRFMPLRPSWDLGVIAGCVTVQCVTAIRMRSPRIPYQLLWLARGMATISLGYSISMLHRTGPGSIGVYGFLVVSLTVVSLSIFLLHMDVDAKKRVAAIIVFFLLGLLPAGIMHFTGAARIEFPQDWVYSGMRRVPVIVIGDSKSSDLQNLLDEINRSSRPGEGVFVGPSDLRFTNYNDTFIYYLLPHLRPVSRYLEMDPGCANRLGSGLTRELLNATWLILTTRFDNWSEPNTSVIPGSGEPNDLVRTNFCLLSRYGAWKLFHKCRLGSGSSSHDRSLNGV